MITSQDLINRFGEREIVRLSDKTQSHQINEANVQAAIDDAIAEAQSYLSGAGFFRLPETLPTVLKIKVCDIARWYLYENGITEIVEKRYQAAIAWLKQVQKNPTMLGFEAKTDAQEAIGSRIVVLPNVLDDWKDSNVNQF
ncbi:DUF1320 domain-containing protein [Kingella negevensis]|uniref:DUF1320 domain-containing protein n=1 Tax=Kingella negevensis TaxID=1522312 RepID=UPI002542E1D0|nr:DUF1320 domain-containing protein [Kingella negevensis]WII93186.1 DUF1320 domain-containing protein [Kingella negevensis]